MDIVQATDRILVSIGIGMSAAFHLFRFSIMTLMPAIEDIKTDVLLEGLSLERVLIITVGVLVSISPTLLAIKNRGQRVSLCHLQIFLLIYILCTCFYDLWKMCRNSVHINVKKILKKANRNTGIVKNNVIY